jgi:hypothetical protein
VGVPKSHSSIAAFAGFDWSSAERPKAVEYDNPGRENAGAYSSAPIERASISAARSVTWWSP